MTRETCGLSGCSECEAEEAEISGLRAEVAELTRERDRAEDNAARCYEIGWRAIAYWHAAVDALDELRGELIEVEAMKFRVTIKAPGALDDAIKDAADESVKAIDGLSDSERKEMAEVRASEMHGGAARWYKYGEYLTVEIDTEAWTRVVVWKP